MSTVIHQSGATPIKCPRCSHSWAYNGKNNYVATCPHCRTTLSIRKNKIILQVDRKCPNSGQPVANELKGVTPNE